MRQAKEKEIVVYADCHDFKPWAEWLTHLKDPTARARILARLKRLKQGNYGDCKPVGEGVFELRFFFGPGYRVYFAEFEGSIILLLCGGDKSSQTQDIKQAIDLWREYHERLRHS